MNELSNCQTITQAFVRLAIASFFINSLLLHAQTLSSIVSKSITWRCLLSYQPYIIKNNDFTKYGKIVCPASLNRVLFLKS